MKKKYFRRVINRLDGAKARLRELDQVLDAEFNRNTHTALYHLLTMYSYLFEQDQPGAVYYAPPYYSVSVHNDPLQLERFYETYIGISDKLNSRFDVAYLAKIPIDVLFRCIPAIQRADYLVQQGRSTSVVATHKSIIIPVVEHSDAIVFASDLQYWTSTETFAVNALCFDSALFKVVDVDCERVEYYDNLVTDHRISEFVSGKLAPQYDASKHLYYDRTMGNASIPEKYLLMRPCFDISPY